MYATRTGSSATTAFERARRHGVRGRKRRILGALVLLLGMALNALAQSTREPGAPIRFRHLGVEDGLSHQGVHVLHQDSLGFLWIGTQDGLNRYDGTEVQVYRPVPFDTTSLDRTFILELLPADDGGFWIAGDAGILSRYHPTTNTFSNTLGRPRGPTIGAAQVVPKAYVVDKAPDGTLWMGGRTGGLYKYEPATGALARVPHPPAHPGGRFTAIHADRHGRVWVGTQRDGLFRFDTSANTFSKYRPAPGGSEGLPSSYVLSVLEDQAGRLWVGTHAGLARFDEEADAFVSQEGLRGEEVWSLLEDPAGMLWVGLGEGLAHFDPNSGEVLTLHRHDPANPASLAQGLVRTLFLDRSGVVWVGTDNGLSAFGWSAPPFHQFGHDPNDPNSLDDASVWSVLAEGDSVLWVGTRGGLNRIDRASGRVERFAYDPNRPDGLAPGWVMALRKADDGTLWVGTGRHPTLPGALQRFDPATGRALEHYVIDPSDPTSLPTDTPWNLFEDSRGRFWILGGGTDCFAEMDRARGTFTPYCPDPNDPAKPSTASKEVVEGTDGTLWMGTWGGGLDHFDPSTGQFTRHRHDPADRNTPANDDIKVLHGDASGALWLGYYGAGLSRFDPATGTYTHYNTTNSDLPNDVVYAIEEDAAGHLWISTNRGLTRFTPSLESFDNFGLSDGLQGLEFNVSASHRAPGGELFFGGINGLNAFHPEEIKKDSAPPAVVITSVAVDGEAVAPGVGGALSSAATMAEEVRLAPGQRDVAFRFAALHYVNPRRNRYQYRLEGYEDGWRTPGEGPEATYTNLDPGRYTFHVRAANAEGVWNKEGAQLAVVVEPFFYETWWFAALIVMLAVGLFATGYRNRVRRLTSRQEELETLVEERTQDLRAEKRRSEMRAERLREVDRLKSRFFTNVSHEFRTPLTLTIGPLEDLQAEALPAPSQQRVDLALANSRRLLHLINQLLDIAKLEVGEMRVAAQRQDLAAFLDTLACAFVPLAERRDVHFDVELPRAPLPVYFDPEKMEQVVSNLLSNAFKFTPEGGAIRVVLHEGADGSATIEVRDSGPGIPEDVLPHLFERFYQVERTHAALQAGTGIGLALAKELTELHGGRIAVESTVGFGSTFTVTLPLGRDHLRDDQVVESNAEPDQTSHMLQPELAGLMTKQEDGQAPEREDDDTDDRTTVLVVDDNPDIRAYVRGHLKASYRVLEASDGAEAFARTRAALPDLVVSDVMMPEMDGFELVRALRADRDTDFIPVILLTAKATADERIEGLGEGADDYLTKPFNVAELRARVENLIASRRKLKERFLRDAPPSVLPEPSGDGADVAVDDLSASDRVLVDRVRAVIEAHVADENFTVEQLAEAVSVSRSTLHARLRAALDVTPSGLIRAIRLERAAALLRAHEGTISEVAYAVGFKSVSHFSQSFKKAYDTTPSAYADEQTPA